MKKALILGELLKITILISTNSTKTTRYIRVNNLLLSNSYILYISSLTMNKERDSILCKGDKGCKSLVKFGGWDYMTCTKLPQCLKKIGGGGLTKPLS